MTPEKQTQTTRATLTMGSLRSRVDNQTKG
jgi:hypothetical protein